MFLNICYFYPRIKVINKVITIIIKKNELIKYFRGFRVFKYAL